MSVLLCKMCGGDLEVREGMSTVKCPYCGTNQTLPKCNDEQRLRMYDRANHFRRSNDYDKAMAVYEQILNEDQTESEAYWSIVLCRYGIEYVEDPATHKRIPTVNRAQYTSVLADEDYKAALRYADVVQAEIYKQEAETIDRIQKGILMVSQKEAPYDIFICCKETDEEGNRTRDSVLADELYYELTRNGFKVFWARITLQDKPGTAYEPYIFAALHSAGVMIVMGTKPEYFQAVWVRNEWSRYLSLIKSGERKVLIPAYRDMDPYDLPKEFSHLQALDMARLGFTQDLLYGIRRIAGNTASQQRVDQPGKADYIPLSEAGRIEYEFLDDRKIRSTGWEPYGWKRGVVIGIVLVLGILLINSPGLYRRWKMNRQETAGIAEETELTEENFQNSDLEQDQDVEEEGQEPAFTGVLEKFVAGVFQCPAENVSDGQLGKIRQLVINRDSGVWKIGYSFDEPAGGMLKTSRENIEGQFGEEFVWSEFSLEEELNLSCLRRFANVKKLDIDAPVSETDIKGLPLESISAYFDDPASAADVLEHPENMKELGFNAGGDSLNGIELFENLETLFIDYSDLDDIDPLIHLQNLKNLTLAYNANLKDFAVLGKLSKLEKLSLGTEGLKSLDFAGELDHLNTLNVDGGNLRSLAGLEECDSLLSLSITNCMNIKNMDAVSGLGNLQELVLQLPYGCSEPELDRLTRLRKLSINNMEDCSFLQNMSGLTELHMRGCILPENMDVSKLSSLKALSFTSGSGKQLDVETIESFQMIECLDIQGSETYDDISGLFQMPNLKELNISGVRCEINFDAVAENPVLEVLHMDDICLYENVEVETYSIMTAIDYDEVLLDEHMDFVRNFSGLKELYISGNNLTDLSFVINLPALEVLDITDNYITQLRPLAELPSLRKVVCPGNPLRSEKVLKDSVMIIKETAEE